MFYCDDCRRKNNWPISIQKSFGTCECCGKVTNCNNISHEFLTPTRKEKKEREGKCPKCEEGDIIYETIEDMGNGFCFYEVQCMDCGWTGREKHHLEFRGYWEQNEKKIWEPVKEK